MRIPRTACSWLVALAISLAATKAYGDGYCAKGFRDTTAAERGQAASVLAAAKQALPPPPTGWTTTNDSVDDAPASFCMDQESVPWIYSATRYYQRVDDQEARNKVIMDAAQDYQASLAAKQPRLDAIMAKMTALSQQVAEAAQKNDWARVEELNKEVEKVSTEYKQVLEEGGANEKMEAATARASQDREMIVSVRVNSGFEGLFDTAAPYPVPAGGKSAYRWSEKRGDADEDVVLVLLGEWKPPTGGQLEAVLAPNAAAQTAQVMSVRVSAAANRIVQMVEAIDFNALAATLSK